MCMSAIDFFQINSFCSSTDGYFFFQAEDGIRDGRVTGVQTCALPICPVLSLSTVGAYAIRSWTTLPCTSVRRKSRPARSEERRVGKECRSRWPSYHSKYVCQPLTISKLTPLAAPPSDT